MQCRRVKMMRAQGDCQQSSVKRLPLQLRCNSIPVVYDAYRS